MKHFFCIVLLVCAFSLRAQNYTISGYIKDAKNGEALIGVSVYEKGTTNGVTTNVYGFYSLSLPKGTHEVSFTYIGYATQTFTLDFSSAIKQNIEMSDEASTLNEVVVSSEREDRNVQSTEMSVAKLDIKEINKVPALLGEIDVVRTIQLLPGVTTVGEGASGFNVRGGNIDQNLILLDEAPVYNSSHLFGFFSVFNPDAVKDVKLIKGGIPAQYGGRLSSILDIRMKEGNKKNFQVTGGIGTIFSRLAVEGPLIKDKASFIVAARRSYLDILAKPILSAHGFKNLKFNFYDLTAKINYHINDKNNLFASGYFGRDVFGAGFGFNWGNSTASLRWNHLFNDKLFLNTTAYFSDYVYNLSFTDESNNQGFDWTSHIKNYSIKPDFTYYLNNRHTMHFGGQSIYYVFYPGNATITASDGSKSGIDMSHHYAMENALYAGDEFKVTNFFNVEAGLRYSLFNYLGDADAYYFNDTLPNNHHSLQKTVHYGSFKTIAQYGNFEPRASMKFQLTDNSSVKASYNRTAQYLQLVSNTAAATPLDIWTPATNNIKPQKCDQYAIGYFRNFKDNMFETSVELYYKHMQNQLDYVDNATLLLNTYYEGELIQGKGKAYGVEFFVKKRRGKFTGWISYTYARTLRLVNGISNNDWYPSKFDRPNNLSVVLMYEFNKRWNISTNFIYITGTPNTFPNSRFEIQGYYVGYNTTNMRNNFRNPDYNRLDFSATYNFKRNDTHKWKSSIVLSVYNAYARKNTFAVYFQSDKSMPINTQAIRYSVVGTIIPAITYNFTF